MLIYADYMLHKSEVRAQSLYFRKSLPSEIFRAFDHQISTYAGDILTLLHDHVSQSLSNQRPISIAAYLPQTQEPGSRKLLQTLRDHGIRLYCPLIHFAAPNLRQNIDEKILDWAEYTGQEQLNRWDIPEPYPVQQKTDVPFHAMIIPALAIDSLGNRLGRGGGYYDRSLPICTTSQTILLGMCFSAEILPENYEHAWKSDPWDIPVHYTISEKYGLQPISRTQK